MKSADERNIPPAKAGRRSATLREIARQTVVRAREGHLSVPRQIMEMVVLRLVYGLGPGHYHAARYWRRGLPWDFKTGFWPYSKFRRVISAINPPAYQKLSQNKVCEKALLSLVNIPTARFVGSLHHRRGLSSSGRRLTGADDLQDVLRENPDLTRLCFKLVEGFGGQGFRAVEVIRTGGVRLRVLGSGEVLSVADFLSEVLALEAGGDYVVEAYIEQHPELARFNPSSVNTLRVWACCVNGKTDVIDAFLRVGGRGSLVDNTSMGAQIFRVDLQSGTIGEGMSKKVDNATFRCHRDSGEPISGASLPFWSACLNVAKQAVVAFPNINFAGVDIAITATGPVVIELNVEPDPTSAIIFDRSHRDLLSCFRQARE